jgi:hypothetical protein
MTADYDFELDNAVAMLSNSSSVKRKSAAARLRKMKNLDSGVALLEALKKEIEDPRTWEAQYQMIMALSACKHREALPFLQKLAQEQGSMALMSYSAIGYALVELEHRHDEDSEQMLLLLDSGKEALITGGLLALAILQIKIDECSAVKIFDYLRSRSCNSWDYYYTAIAAAGWQYPAALDFLKLVCLQEHHSGLRADQPKGSACPTSHLERAIESSLKGKYLNWTPL